ncbi:MAG TPA: tetratricopeptide repeat protein [Stenotrophomonas sp.]|jgi:hypothetical protein
MGMLDRRIPRLRRAWHCAVYVSIAQLLLIQGAGAAEADLARARAYIAQGQYQQAADALAPMEQEHSTEAEYNYLMGRAWLGLDDAAKASASLQRSLEISPDSVDAHLALGRAYYALGQYADARIAFQTALHFDNLPPDLLSQVEIYEEAAQERLEGQALTHFGYAEIGLGRYRVNSTRGTDAFGGGDRRDVFYNARLGGGLNYAFDDGYAFDATLDYRFRYYDNRDSRNDSDLRWSASGSRSFGDNNWAMGVRGRVSYRGNGDYRNDAGVFTDYVRSLDSDDQLKLGAEVRRRRYPQGPLRDRSRTTSTVSVGWVHAIGEGNASFSADVHGGRNGATSRPDGDSSVFGATVNLDYAFNDHLDGYIFGWWERDSFNTDALHFHPDALDEEVILRRKDNLYEAGLGLIWGFAPNWSLRPELLYIRDQSNSVGFNYSSLEMWANVRWRF